jgi:hypothetical protein
VGVEEAPHDGAFGDLITMRVYVADARSRALQDVAWHLALAVLLVVSVAFDNLSMVGLVAIWHVDFARRRWVRSRELGRVASGYVEVTPVIMVVTLRPDRDRKYEVDPHLRN